MWPFRRKSSLHGSGCTDPDCAGWPRCTPATPPQQLCFRSYDLPSGRTWESFRFLVEDIWVASAVDECVTDDEAEVARLVAAGIAEDYDMRVTDRTTGKVTYTKRPD
jgi:hypothetical protein